MLLNRHRLLLSFGLLLALPAWAGTSMSFASGQNLFLTPSFQTAGVIIKTAHDDGNETIAVEVKGPTDTAFHAVHPTTRFEPNGWATSLFDLKQDTDYSLRITLADPDGVTGAASQTVTIHTLPEPVTPVPLRTLWVGPSGNSSGPGTSQSNPFDTIASAAAHAQPGDRIRVLAGTYGPVSITLNGTATAPIWIVADDVNHLPSIMGDGAGGDAAFDLEGSSYVIVDGFEIQNGGDDDDGIGLYLHRCTHITAQNNYIHDNGHYDVLISKSAEFPGGDIKTVGYHLIQNNRIADVTAPPCTNDDSHSECPGVTYYGVKQDNNPGAANVIRNNEVWGHSDNFSPCGDEDVGDTLTDGEPITAIIGNGDGSTTGIWTNHDMEIYGNNVHDAHDDAMELDGICVNARVWRNTLNSAQNGLSVAPALPGPYFLIRNVVTGAIQEGGVKLNTAVSGSNTTRHIFVYHNSFIYTQNIHLYDSEATLLNLWFSGSPCYDHNLGIHDVRFRNNIFAAEAGTDEMTDANNFGLEQPSFDGDDWYNSNASGAVWHWYNGMTPGSCSNLSQYNNTYTSFSAFQSGTQEEAHGLYAEPKLDSSFVPLAGSPVVDKAVLIPGINDVYAGSAPDIGAYELGTTVAPDGGMPVDAGVPNADGGVVTVLPDGGIGPGLVTGCSCGAGTSASASLFTAGLMLAGLIAFRTRRRQD